MHVAGELADRRESLSLPEGDALWVERFLDGFLALAAEHGVALVGGDTTRGPLVISITVFGEVPEGLALLRSGAKAGDDIYVSGNLGELLDVSNLGSERPWLELLGQAAAYDGTPPTLNLALVEDLARRGF